MAPQTPVRPSSCNGDTRGVSCKTAALCAAHKAVKHADKRAASVMKFASLANLAVTGRLHQEHGAKEAPDLAAPAAEALPNLGSVLLPGFGAACGLQLNSQG